MYKIVKFKASEIYGSYIIFVYLLCVRAVWFGPVFMKSVQYSAVWCCCTVDKALPHTMSTDASLGSIDVSTHSVPAPHKSMSLDLDNLSHPVSELSIADTAASRARRSARCLSTQLATDVQVVVVWLESFEDHLTFPVGKVYLLGLLWHIEWQSCKKITDLCETEALAAHLGWFF